MSAGALLLLLLLCLCVHAEHKQQCTTQQNFYYNVRTQVFDPLINSARIYVHSSPADYRHCSFSCSDAGFLQLVSLQFQMHIWGWPREYHVTGWGFGAPIDDKWHNCATQMARCSFWVMPVVAIALAVSMFMVVICGCLISCCV